MTQGLLSLTAVVTVMVFTVGCGQSTTPSAIPAPAALDLAPLGVAAGDRVADVARHNGVLHIVARPTNAPRYLIVQGKVLATAPGFRTADGLAVAANGVYAWTPVEDGMIVLEESDGRIEIPGTVGLGIDEIEVAEPYVLILARDGGKKRLLVYDKAEDAVVADESLASGSWMIQHQDGTPTWIVPKIEGATKAHAPWKFRDPGFPFDIVRHGSWGSGGGPSLGFGYRDQEINVSEGTQASTARFTNREFALPRLFEVSSQWLLNDGVLLYISDDGTELISQPLPVAPNPIEPSKVYALPQEMVAGGVGLHSDMDDGVVFISGGGWLLEYDLATRSLRTPQ